MVEERIHATAVALLGQAALIRGPSGSGKSDLALRCLMLEPGPLLPGRLELVADDQVFVEHRDGRLLVSCPDTIRGRLEVRGLGIIDVPVAAEAELALVVDLTDAAVIERIPDRSATTTVAGVPVACLRLAPFEASAPAKLALALAATRLI